MRYNDLAVLVVHVRPYRETSAMVQFFSREQGRLVGVMKGLRRGRNPVQVQPFTFGSLSCYGRGSMVTVTQFDADGRFALAGDALSAGFYVLEIITRSLIEWQSEPGVFAATCKVLAQLAQEAKLAPCLRLFEADLLGELGYGLDYFHEMESAAAIESQAWYEYVPLSGFRRVQAGATNIPGWVLMAIGERDFSNNKVLRAARYLHQQALAPLLGPRPLVSRSLLRG